MIKNIDTIETVTLTTYDDNNIAIDKEFTIPTKYAREKIMEKFNQTLEFFLDNYTLGDTEWLMVIAENDGVLIK